jgi:hypothetical protein
VTRRLALAALRDAARLVGGLAQDAVAVARLLPRSRGHALPLRRCCLTFEHDWHTPRCQSRALHPCNEEPCGEDHR